MFLAVFGLPVAAPKLCFNDDSLASFSQSSKILCRLTPHGHVYESSDLLASAVAVVEEVIVSDRGGSHWSSGISFSQDRISDQVATDNDAIDIHEFIGRLSVAFLLNSRHPATRRLGRVRPDPRLLSRRIFRFRFGG